MRDWLTHHSWVTRQSWPNPSRTLSFWPAGRMTTAPRLIVMHSTETTGFPGYGNGAAAPHFTIDLRSGAVRQHIPLSWGSRCLAVSTGGVTDRTVNVSGTIQIEVIGAVTPGYPARYGHYDLVNTFPNDERAHAYLGRLWRAIHDETGIPLQFSSLARWVPYPSSYGVRASQRLSSSEFRAARGIVGHQHAPANDHGDGLLGRASGGRPIDMEKALARARGSKPAPSKPSWETPEHVRTVQRLLNDVTDADLKVDGIRGPATEKATRTYQSEYRNDLVVDGSPGPATLRALEEDMSAIKDLRADIKRLEKKVDAKPSAAQIVKELLGHKLYGFAVNWWLRRGSLGTDYDHRNYPADPGSPADLELRIARAVMPGEDVKSYGDVLRKEKKA